MSPKKPRGLAHEWTNAEQKLWLEARKAAYTAAQTQNDKKFSDFWAETFEGWFTKWPSEPPTEEERAQGLDEAGKMKKTKVRLKQWFNNHSRGGALKTGERRKVLNLNKNNKLCSTYQVYLTLYYKQKLKQPIRGKWEVYYRGTHPEHDVTKDVPKTDLWFTNQKVREYYENETEDVKKEVEAARNTALANGSLLDNDEDEEVDPDERKRRQMLAKYQRTRASLPVTIIAMLEQVEREAGLIGTVMLAGPDIEQGGNIYSITIHHGRTPAGNDFGTVYKDFKTHVEAPFQHFAGSCFPPQARLEFALPGTESFANYLQTGSGSQMSTPSASIGFPSGPSTPVPRASRDSTPHTQSAPLIRQVILRSLPPGHSLISTGPAQPAPAPPQYPSSTVDAIRSNDNDQANETLQVDPSDDEPDPESDADSQKSGDSWAAEVDKLLGKSQVKAKGKMKGSGKAKGKGKGKGKRQASSYELEKEANIARNKALGAELHAKWGVLQSEFEQPKTKSRAQAKKDKKAVAAEPQHRSQRQSDSSSAVVLQIPVQPGSVSTTTSPWLSAEGLPSWLKGAIGELQALDGRPGWVDLVEGLWLLDTALGYPSGKGKAETLSAKGWPAAIANWVKSYRSNTATPNITNLTKWGKSWWGWWISLQPKSRGGEKLLRVVEVGETWAETKKGGLNGFYNVVVSLSWWMTAVKTDPERAEFDAALADALWVLNQMVDRRQSNQD